MVGVALDGPRSLREFARRFGTEAACEAFLFALRYPEGFVCPRCSARRGWPIRHRRVVECPRGHQISLTAGTVLHRTRQDLVTWFHAAYLVSTLTPGISALQFQRQLGLSRYETAFQMLHKLRAALIAPDRERLHGEIEVDETPIGGRDPGKDGWGGDKVVVACAVEVRRWTDQAGKARTRAGRVRLEIVSGISRAAVLPFVLRNVEPGALVHSDGSWAYWTLPEHGYRHDRIVQGRGPTAKYRLAHLHRVISNLRGWLEVTHGGAVRPKHLQAYLNEFAFRFNRRFWRGPSFLRALGLAVEPRHGPTYASLYRAGAGGWTHPVEATTHRGSLR